MLEHRSKEHTTMTRQPTPPTERNTQGTRLPLLRRPRNPLRNLGLIVVAYLVYGAVLLGTSAVVASADDLVARSPQQLFTELLFGASGSRSGASPEAQVRLNGPAAQRL